MKSDISKRLGSKIKELREMRGLSQAALAQKCLKSVETISNFERGKTTPSIATVERLAKVLGVDIKQFFELSKQSDKKSKTVILIENRLSLLSVSDQEAVAAMVDSLCKQRTKR